MSDYDYRENRAVLQVHEKGYFDNPTEAASAIFAMSEKIYELEAALADREARIAELEQKLYSMTKQGVDH